MTKFFKLGCLHKDSDLNSFYSLIFHAQILTLVDLGWNMLKVFCKKAPKDVTPRKLKWLISIRKCFYVKFPHPQWQIISEIAFESLIEIPFNCLRFELCSMYWEYLVQKNLDSVETCLFEGTKGHLILKGLFGAFNYSKKRTKRSQPEAS